jgi:hypothetical protein
MQQGQFMFLTLVDSKGHEFSAMILKIHAFMGPTKSWVANNLLCLHSNLLANSAKNNIKVLVRKVKGI